MSKFIEFFWIFITGSFIGYICEMIWCIIRWKKIESRKGLIYGHLIPIYGIATVIISFIIEIFNIEKYILFLVVGGTRCRLLL